MTHEQNLRSPYDGSRLTRADPFYSFVEIGEYHEEEGLYDIEFEGYVFEDASGNSVVMPADQVKLDD